MSVRVLPGSADDQAGPPGSRDLMTLAEIVANSPAWTGPDRHTAREGLEALLGMLTVAFFFGATGGLVLCWVLLRALAYLA